MHIHVLGICGTFMGSLAVLAKELGHRVTGSDANVYPPMSTQLQAQGIELMQGYDPAHLEPAPDLVVIGNALSRGNPAVEHVLNKGLPYVSGPQWQARLLAEDGSRFEVLFDGIVQGEVDWPLTGLHNVANALASLAAARHVGVMPSQGAAALSEFRNVKRRMEKVAEVRGVTLYDDFAHHPTAIATTLDGLRKQVGADTQVIAIVEPRSNSMKLGAHRDGLPDSVRQADQVLWYAPPNLGWDLAATAAQCAIPSQVCDTLEAIIEQVRQQARPGAQVVIMSNGGFGGLHGKLAAALAE